ncbi:unnamed protein product [Prorocentrum cordatum]|uniref:Uncharacterized protein n=1 Tax=Prorocentrum cordatum TaxID=2364126 RepID=A0ABN9T6M4_9DINO|nr:unnamed protein product [Polarella glacialis]
MASPLLAGLTRTGTEAPAAVPEQRRREKVPKLAWADLSDDLDDGLSECSTQAPGCSSGAASSDGHGESSGGPAARRGTPGSPVQPWLGSMLAQGLRPALPELGSLVNLAGACPAGAHAVVTAVDREEGTCKFLTATDPAV